MCYDQEEKNITSRIKFRYEIVTYRTKRIRRDWNKEAAGTMAEEDDIYTNGR